MSYARRTDSGLGADGIRVGRYHTTPATPELLAPQSLP